MTDAVARLRGAPIGSRMVVRYRIPGGFTDALGYLVAITDAACTIRTRKGDVQIALTDVALAKPVPPPPPRPGPAKATSRSR